MVTNSTQYEHETHDRDALEEVVEEESSHSVSIVQLCSTMAITFFSYSRLKCDRWCERGELSLFDELLNFYKYNIIYRLYCLTSERISPVVSILVIVSCAKTVSRKNILDIK